MLLSGGGYRLEKQVSIDDGGMNDLLFRLKISIEMFQLHLNEKIDLMKKTKDIDFALLALHGKYGEDWDRIKEHWRFREFL
ncbi:hypothetical protein CW304_27585 [Bacillus sp. UFRGS-B20]|nr:hypothetical protein CW304_27585 [Bacillus sp. UFRGS-B20]